MHSVDIRKMINTKELRVCQFYWNYLFNNEVMHDKFIQEPRQISAYLDDIVEYLESDISTVENPNSVVLRMLRTLSEQSLKDDILDNISITDCRLCYWLWRKLAENNVPNPDTVTVIADTYQKLHLPDKTFSTKERHAVIVRYLDCWDKNALEKQEAILALLDEWNRVKEIESFSWFNINDEQQSEWLYDRISASPAGQSLNPTNTVTTASSLERAIIAIGYFDLWREHYGYKELFINKVKNAWTQQKHRDKIKTDGKRNCNVILKNRTKKRLDEMATERGMSRNNFLEWLINKEFGNK
ncbi:hypothetical protein VCRA2113O415_210014 [Vibrio crassostreae]|nr:hypothetical protein VCRA2113O415_210014 [Vibrio crassostreae]CAK2680512.1 hypothetical protein VCRA2113O420_220080 [Vibrio crassostreae]CAK3287538.1 hypothetical protein VCRA2121O436_220080 [Vibrio crassostreae]